MLGPGIHALVRFCSLFAWLLLALVAPAARGAERPNILFILVDDLGPEWLSCFGSEHATPSIDRLAKSGVRFTHCYATPLCTPSRHVLYTGRYPFRTGWVIHHDVPRWGEPYFDWTKEVTFFRYLRDAGYATAIGGKWQLNDLRRQPDALWHHGFDEHCVWPGAEAGQNRVTERYFDPFVQTDGRRPDCTGKFGPDVFNDYLIDFMRRRRNGPFLAFHSMVLTHTPLTTTPLNRDRNLKGTALFAGMVDYLDHQVGQLLEVLDDLKIRDKTMVILVGDNGTVKGVPCRMNGRLVDGGKATLLETGICVPLIISYPGKTPAGRVSDELIDFSDFLPTLLELAGVRPLKEIAIDGQSFAATLLGEPEPRPRRGWIYSQYGRKRVIRNRRFKLTSDGRLYDLYADPEEKRDLASSLDSEAKAAQTRLMAALDSLPSGQSLPFPQHPERGKEESGIDSRARRNLAFSPSDVSGKKPNILIFLADDLGIGDIGCYGCKDIRTPHIDLLARDGIRLTHYYSAAPLCAPSRAALLTGRSPARIGLSLEKNMAGRSGEPGLPAEETTLGELARAAGYATGAIGKWHLGFTPESSPHNQGFDFFFGFYSSLVDYYSHMNYWTDSYFHDLYRNREEVHLEGQHTTDLFTGEAIQFIDKHQKDPFLLYVAFNAPHYPMVPQARHRQTYPGVPKARAEYAALVAGLDEAVGVILEHLDKRGLSENTLVILTSDNGCAPPSLRGEGGGSNHPYREYKRSLFDGGIHMPCVLRWPAAVTGNQTRSQLAIAMDLFPTVAEVLGGEAPVHRAIEGRSWVPFLLNPDAPGHKTLCFEWDNQSAVRQGKWKLVRNGYVDLVHSKDNPGAKARRAQGVDGIFLSDMDSDPGEQVNLRFRHPEVVDALLREHAAWLKSISDDRAAEGGKALPQ
ncbi:MAG: sulfatase-like hydrolase/transferase [Phycisphaerae bacterium]|nr:sulfatase-like hydrolase/transferase [Phycisphaerae bacterium]